MANFIKLPVIDVSDTSNFVNSGLLVYERFTLKYYAATNNGDVYAARVNDDLYFVCISSGYYGYICNPFGNPLQSECTSTDYSTIYDTYVLSMPANTQWSADFTIFESESDMLSMFYDTFVDTQSANKIIVRVIAEDDDSNEQGGTSVPDIGNGSFDDTSNPIPLPNIPTISAADSGLITIFRPSLQELKALGEYLWTNIDDFEINLKKVFSNPMDYFIAFHILPCYPDVDTARQIKLGLWTTNIYMPPVIRQFNEIDLGTIVINPYWGSALDYAPYTKISLFLPFIGSVSLNTDEVMGQTIGLVYRIDLLTGKCVACLTINQDALYQFTGECSVSIPLTGADWSRVYSAAIGATTTLVSGVAGIATVGGYGAQRAFATAQNAEAVGSIGSAFAEVNASSKGVRGVQEMRERLLESANAATNAAVNVARSRTGRSAALRASAISQTVNNVAGNIMGAKPIVQHTGSITGSAGFMGMRTPYVLIEYPNQSLAENYKHYVGYPSNMYANLGSCSGYTECEQVIVSGINATDSEIAEITEALKQGVYL